MISSINAQLMEFLTQHTVPLNGRTVTQNVSFEDILIQAVSRNEPANCIQSYIKSRFNAKIHVEAVPNILRFGDDSIHRQWAFNTIGDNNVVIAPNILEKMANDPDIRAYYTNQIQSFFDYNRKFEPQTAMWGRQVVSAGVIIHEDGSVTSWSVGDYTPEERARLERAMREEDEARARRRAEEAQSADARRDARIQDINSLELQLHMRRLQASIGAHPQNSHWISGGVFRGKYEDIPIA